MKKSSALLWLLAFLLTMLLAVFQRLTGPTYPVKGRQTIAGIAIQYKFYRSWTSHKPLSVRVSANGDGLALRLYYAPFPLPAAGGWAVMEMAKREGVFEAKIPGGPTAGKMAYKVEAVTPAAGRIWLHEGRPVIARFKGKVPAFLLVLHIIFMFAGLLLAFRTGLGALFRDGAWLSFVPWTLAVTLIGGLLLGPLVQKCAFGNYWTGFPLGSDLTDSKTLFAVLFWLGAFLLRRRSRWWTISATILMLVVFLIPHSVLGSELDYKTGKVETSRPVKN